MTLALNGGVKGRRDRRLISYPFRVQYYL